MKVFVVLCLVAGALGILEPAGYQPPSSFQGFQDSPSQKNLNNEYLAPHNAQQNSNRESSRYYLAPSVNRAPSSQYEADSSSTSSSFSPPSHQSSSASSFPANSYSAHSSASSSPTNLYSAPSTASSSQANSYSAHSSASSSPKNIHSAPSTASSSQANSYSSRLSTSSSQANGYSYSSPSFASSSPSNSYSSPERSSSSPSNSYSSPGRSSASPSNSFGALSQKFDKMAVEIPSAQYLSQNGKQDYSSGRSFEEISEPANYNFEYQVNDEFGNDFGHKEERQDDKSYGMYNVLLPNGRKQIVEYEAGEQGFKPKISYEETGAEGGFKNANSQNQEGPY